MCSILQCSRVQLKRDYIFFVLLVKDAASECSALNFKPATNVHTFEGDNRPTDKFFHTLFGDCSPSNPYSIPVCCNMVKLVVVPVVQTS